jgi:thimet oligopeptidase
MTQMIHAESVLHPWLVADSAGLTAWVDERLARHTEALAALTAVEGARTIDNTLARYDEAVAELSAAGSQAGLLDSVHPDKAIRDTAQAETQKISQAGVALGLNQEVFAALSAIDPVGLDSATSHYLQRTLLQYRLAGVDKDEPTRARLKELQDKATLLSLTFSRTVQEDVKQVLVEDAGELEGLPADFITAHQPNADGKIVLTTEFPDYAPVMTFAKSDALRRRMFLAYQTRAYPANKQVLLDLLAVRREIAGILGFETWADLATADQMMGSSAKMQAFIDELDVATKAGAEHEYKQVLDFVNARAAQHGEPEIEAIDGSSRGYWLELYRRQEFDFDSQSVRPYFPYDKVEAGILETAEKLFRVAFKQVDDAEVWHESVRTFDVYDSLDGSSHGHRIGRFYLDMHPREGKDKWFSAAPLVPGICDKQVPEAALICNFPGGDGKDAGLMQHSDVVTYFHEFGHLMHAILGGQQRWAGISGIATEGDFVEVPSQMLEEFFRDPRLLASFAHHHETGEPIPAELVLKMNRAGAFGRADSVRTQLFYTSYSLDVHRLDPSALDLDALLVEDYGRFLPYTWIDGNRLYASFGHLVGYSSNYYTYLYDKVIALDFFSIFPRADLLSEDVAVKYRRKVLEPGGGKPGAEIVLSFLNRTQSFDPFTKWIGEAQKQERGTAVYD